MAKVHTLTDNFDDNSLHAQWSKTEAGAGVVSETSSKLVFIYSGGGGSAKVEAVSSYDIEDSSMYAQLTFANPGAGLWPHIEFGFKDADGNGYIFYNELGLSLRCRRFFGNPGSPSQTDILSPSYDPTNHRWLKLEEASGTLSFYGAPDSSGSPGSWTLITSESTHADLDMATVKPYMGFVGGIAETFYFDGFNTAASGGGGGGSNKSLYYRSLYGF